MEVNNDNNINNRIVYGLRSLTIRCCDEFSGYFMSVCMFKKLLILPVFVAVENLPKPVEYIICMM